MNLRLPNLSLSWPEQLSIRSAGARDVEKLTAYFGTLSTASRYNRFMGAVSSAGCARIAVDTLTRHGGAHRFTVVAEWRGGERDDIIGEASYAFDRETELGEVAMSVCDRWQRRGLGAALLGAVQADAITLGCAGLVGETLRANDPMISFARKAGFGFARSPDWRALKLEKHLCDDARSLLTGS